ncbi:MAG: AAA family ATPase [Methylococcales bacterium]|nr:AAA family ATPase [Methylococcales bacterium]
MSKLSKISIQGYKSIQNLQDFELTNLNILIGANGAGKSNFISVFKLLAQMYDQRLQVYVPVSGGADALLHYGRKKTPKIQMQFFFDIHDYFFSLMPTEDNRLIFEKEAFSDHGGDIFLDGIKLEAFNTKFSIVAQGHSESGLRESTKYPEEFRHAIKSWRIYHFHDTSDTALVKRIHQASDNLRLKFDAENLAAFLLKLKLKFPKSYQFIVKTIRLVAPFFSDFVLREGEEYIQLEWTEVGNPDTPFKAFVLSDGTLRFICLATLLLQPVEMMADTVLIDEPELGLHPYALGILADLIKRAAEHKQIIISTQSDELINHFSPNDIVVVDRVDNASTFKRLDEEKLKDWLEDYTLGDLWHQNVIGGRPAR